MRCAKRGRRFDVWCCACSTGEEPYSIAITLAEAFARINPSDVDSRERSRHAGAEPRPQKASIRSIAIERIEPDRVRRFFLRGTGAQAGQVRVRPELRTSVSFQRINLLEPSWPVHGPFDAIFCRNVMIYFDKQTQAAILRRFAPLLRPDGLLFVGHSESLFHVSDVFRLRGKTVYELVHRDGRADPDASTARAPCYFLPGRKVMASAAHAADDTMLDAAQRPGRSILPRCAAVERFSSRRDRRRFGV